MTTSEIKFLVTVDENHLPNNIKWEAKEAGELGDCNSIMLAMWDKNENNTMRIDLWTKDMSVDEMKKFYHQNIITLTDTYVRATGDEKTANKVRAFLKELGKEMNVLS